MKKILIAFEGINFPQGALDFIVKLNEKNPILLTAVFVPQFELSSVWSYGSSAGLDPFIPLVSTEEAALIHYNIKRFEDHCVGHSIKFQVHKDFYDFAIKELQKESRFADLLILGSGVFNEQIITGLSTDDLANLSHNVECPILVVPDEFEFPKHVILAYDGSESSVYAIKQFSYVLPEFSDNDTLLLYISKYEEKEFPNRNEIEELTACHFSDLDMIKLPINEKYFSTWLVEKPNSLLVCGSFGRSGLSNLFKKSFVKEILADQLLPVFIAHR